jgi:hypothetical protein
MQFLLEGHAIHPSGGNNFRPNDLMQHRFIEWTAGGTVMNGRITDNSELIDPRTSRSICDAVGERLQQSLRPDSRLPSHLQRLMDELRRRDHEDRPGALN